MEDDWDLQAVVRGCSTATITTTTTSTNTTSTTNTTNNNTCFMPSDFHSSPSFSSFCSSSPPQQAAVVDQLLLFSPPPDPIKSRNAIEELHDLYKPFFPKSQPPQPHPLSSVQIAPPISSFSSLSTPSKDQAQPKQQHQHQQSKQSSHAGSLTTTTPRSKKRKNQLKKVCQVPAESLSSDIWAWRKYGQKPIKGSPYPRGYYRCSSSKGCLARKQVERNRSDPEMFIVTYTAEHNHPAPTHRNSLAGSTRQKPFSPQPAATAGDPTKPTTAKPCSPATSTSVDEEQLLVAPQGTTTEIKEDKASPMVEDEEEEFFGLCDTVVSDDFFVGLEGLAGDYFSDHSPARFGIPWIAKNAAAAAGSI